MRTTRTALAIAAALSSSTLALAQTSTVQLYGQTRVDLNYIDQGDGLPKVDGFHSYDSYIGFRGEEKLGGGLSAWFQCESTLNVTGEEQNTFCNRNSGVGLKSTWGNVFYGNWDTPYKIVHGSVYRPFSTAGAFGNSSLLHNGSAGNGGNGALAVTGGIGTSGAATQQAGFSRRQANTLAFHSGDFGGFQVLAAVSGSDESTSLLAASAPTSKPRLYSVGATYTRGPLYVGAAYEQHRNYNPAGQTFGFGAEPGCPATLGALPPGTALGCYQNGKDHAWEIVAAYTIHTVRLGASYHRKEYETADAGVTGLPAFGIPAAAGIPGAHRETRVNSWAAFADWHVVGPHILRFEYVQAADVKGNSTVPINSLAAPLTAGGARVDDTGARLWGVQYAYAFSKRTEINIGYVKLDNEQNSRHVLQGVARRNTCQGVPGAGVVAPGTGSVACDRDQDAIVVGLRHRF